MQRQSQRQSMEAAEQTGRDPIILASIASVALSWYYFYVRGDTERGIFVGLWPPTLMAFASYFRQAEIRTLLDQGSSGVVTRVQKMLEEQ